MDVNKYQILQTGFVNKSLTIPIQLKSDFLGSDDLIDEYENEMIRQVIGEGRDFEVSRFAHAPETGNTNNTEVNYEFYFYSGSSLSNINNWSNSYLAEGFTPQEVFYYSNSFANSFFKLDLYDTIDEKRQKNYLTLILPTQQGFKENVQMQRTRVDIRKPKFALDYIGDKEGFFIYWLKKRNFLDISTFYMSAKFFNAKKGQFYRMMTGSNTPNDFTNGPQTKITGKNTFDNSQYFYYTVKLDYNTQTYQIFNTYNQRMGTSLPIKWFEYVNP